MNIRFPNLNLEWSYIPRSLRVLDFEFTISGLLLALGLLLGLLLVIVDCKRRGKEVNHYLGMSMAAMAGGVLGARIFYVAFHWDLFGGNIMSMLRIREGGVALYGAIAGAALAGVLYCQLSRQPFWDMADTLVLGGMLAQIIGRFGDFFNRESFGEYADHALAMQLPLGSGRNGEVTELMRENLLERNGVGYIQVSPVFLYESLACLLLFLILLAVNRKKKFPGAVFMRYLTYYGLIRGLMELLRTDSLYFPGTRQNVNLIISICLFVLFGLMAWIRTVMTNKREEVRRQQRERYYQKEEQQAAEMDARDAERERIGQERLGALREQLDLPEEYSVEKSLAIEALLEEIQEASEFRPRKPEAEETAAKTEQPEQEDAPESESGESAETEPAEQNPEESEEKPSSEEAPEEEPTEEEAPAEEPLPEEPGEEPIPFEKDEADDTAEEISEAPISEDDDSLGFAEAESNEE